MTPAPVELQSQAVLRKSPIAPRKMRRYATLIRQQPVMHALNALRFHHSPNARPLEKLLLSAISNWERKYEAYTLEDAALIVKEVHVDPAPGIKRMRPAPHGRGHRIIKRSNHTTILLVNSLPLSETAKAANTDQADASATKQLPAPSKKTKTAQKSTQNK